MKDKEHENLKIAIDNAREYIQSVNCLNDTERLTKEQKEKIKEWVKNYFKEHPELEVPKNEESGLPFWEDDFMMTHSED